MLSAEKKLNAFMLVRVGLAVAVSKKVFHNPQFGTDVQPKSDTDLLTDARTFFSLLSGQVHGVFDAFTFVLGAQRAVEICAGETPIRPNYQSPAPAAQSMVPDMNFRGDSVPKVTSTPVFIQ